MLEIKKCLIKTISDQKFLVFFIFLIFTILVLLEHHYAWFCHDDFGYGSLSYAYDVGINGHSFSASELGDFLIGHYLNWGGRILYFAVNCIVLSLGVHAWRIIQTIIIVGIFFLIYKVLSKIFKKTPKAIVALLTVLSYGFIGIMVARDGIFWATASILYIFPLLPFFCFILMYQNLNKHKSSIFWKIIMCILIFVSTFSYEQLAAGALCFIVFSSINEWGKTKKPPKFHFILLLFAIAGFAILMLAPGNSARMTHPTSADFYALPILDRLTVGFSNVLSNFFSNSNAIFLFIFLSLSIITAISNFKNPISNHKSIRFLNLATILSNSTVFLFNTIFSINGGYFSLFNFTQSHHTLQIASIIIIIFQCILILYSYVAFLYTKKQFILMYLAICALISLCVMVVAPYFPSRAMLPFEFLLFPIFSYIFINICQNRNIKSFSIYLFVPLTLLSLFNIIYITHGYYTNNAANEYNDNILTDTSRKISNGESVQSVTLRKLPNPLFGSDQPYDKNRLYILKWMRKYYNLPQKIMIQYEDI